MRNWKEPLKKIICISAAVCFVLSAYNFMIKAKAKDEAAEEVINIFTKTEDAKQMLVNKEIAEEKVKEDNNLQQWKEKTEAEIKAYIGGETAKFGLVYYDLEKKQKIAINEEKVFTAASTLKVQMNMIAYDRVKSGELSLEEKIQYNSSYYAAGTGRLLADFKKSEAIPVSVLLDYSIKYSDNIATNMILRRLGGSSNVRVIANTMAGTNTETKENKITPEQEFRLLKKLYENREDKNYAHLLEVMKNTAFHDRIDKYLPHQLVAHKIGDYSTYVNDVGIIFTDKPYILVVYTNELPGLGKFEPHEKIAGLSKLIYEAHLKK